MDSKSRRRTRPRTAIADPGFPRRSEGVATTARLAVLSLLVGAMLLAGCGSVQAHRVRQFPEHFAALPPAVQARVEAAVIAAGDHQRTVYLALGTPTYVSSGTQGESVWVYWGSLPEMGAAPAGTIRFHSRSELRMPGPAERRRELRVHFHDERVTHWTLGAIDVEAAAGRSRLRMGTYPRSDGS